MSIQVEFPAEVQFTKRDAIQSNAGNKMPANRCVEFAGNIQDYGVEYVQTSGGDSIGGAARNGIWPKDFVKEVGDHYRTNVPKIIPTALYRSVFGLSLTPQSLSSHRVAMKMLSEDGGVKELQNFHSGNDVNLMGFVPKLASEYGMKAMAGICVQYNPNTMDKLPKILDQHYRDIEALLEQGHEGIYFKCASGVMADIGEDRKVTTEFTEALISGARKNFGYEHKIGVHFHDTYGLAVEAALASVRANEGKGRIVVDLLPPAMAGGTAQADVLMFLHALEHSDDPILKASMPQGLNVEAMRADSLRQHLIRGMFSGSEMRYDKRTNVKAFENRVAGGAVGILKADEGTRTYLKMHLGTDDWEKQQDALLDIMPEVFRRLGYPNIVTPNQHMVISAAKQAIPMQKRGRDIFDVLHPTVVSYVSGEWGRVSEDVDPVLKQRVEAEYGLRRALPAEELPDSISKAREQLQEVGISDASDDEAYVVSLIGGADLKTSDSKARRLIESHRFGNMPKIIETPIESEILSDDAVKLVSANIFQVVYSSLDLQKTESGFYKGVGNPEGRAQQLRDQIAEQRQNIVKTLEGAGYKSVRFGSVLRRVNEQFRKMEQSLGVESSYSGQFDLYSNRITKESDLVSVFGEKSVKKVAEYIVTGRPDQVADEFSRVNSLIQTSNLLHTQKISAVGLFNQMVSDTVKGVPRVKGIDIPERLPELQLVEIEAKPIVTDDDLNKPSDFAEITPV